MVKAGGERGGGVGRERERETPKLEVWRKNKCRRSGQSTSAECKKPKAELRSRY